MIIVTGSKQPYDKLLWLGIAHLPIVVSNGELKEVAALRAGYKVDVWVDNEPGTIQETKILKDDL